MSAVTSLAWGCKQAIPDGVRAAWGCRAILRQRQVDVVWDRTDIAGDDDARTELIRHLNGAVGTRWYRDGVRPPAQDEVFTILDDGIVVFKGRAAGGYLYVTAYLRAHLPA